MMRETELYIHIPFCVRKCGYCDFVSFPAGQNVQKAYVQALLKELETAPEGLSVPTVFIGGGTPSIIDPLFIGELLSLARRRFRLLPEAEITLEANPGTLTAEKLEAYRRAGVNRLSIGLQSARDEELRVLGRIHSFADFKESFSMAREAGFENISVDLMAALPFQTEESFEESLAAALRLSPEHLSVYSLIIEEGTPFYERYHEKALAREQGREDTWPLPTEETERRMYRLAGRRLPEAGYARYEISNYARPGFACRHNIGYWTGVPYLGFGLSASSYFEGKRFSNTADMKAYLPAFEEEGAPSRIRTVEEVVTRERAMEEFMFLGLRMTEGVSGAEFSRRFGRAMEEVYEKPLARMEAEGLLSRRDGRVSLTERGVDLSNYVLAEFLLD